MIAIPKSWNHPGIEGSINTQVLSDGRGAHCYRKKEENQRRKEKRQKRKRKRRSPLAGGASMATLKTTEALIGVPPTPLDQEPPPTRLVDTEKRSRDHLPEHCNSRRHHLPGLCPANLGHLQPSHRAQQVPLKAMNKTQPSTPIGKAHRRRKIAQKNPAEQRKNRAPPTFRPRSGHPKLLQPCHHLRSVDLVAGYNPRHSPAAFCRHSHRKTAIIAWNKPYSLELMSATSGPLPIHSPTGDQPIWVVAPRLRRWKSHSRRPSSRCCTV